MYHWPKKQIGKPINAYLDGHHLVSEKIGLDFICLFVLLLLLLFVCLFKDIELEPVADCP